MRESSRITELGNVLAAELVWEVDPDDLAWLRTQYHCDYLYLRMNDFPDENPYSLWLGDGKFLELDDLPARWRHGGPLNWPPTARRGWLQKSVD